MIKYGLCIGVGIIIGCFLNECTHDPCLPCDPEIRIDTFYKEKPPVKKEFNPIPYKRIKSQRPNLADVDSIGFDSLTACNDINIYSDTLKDSSGTVIVQDSVRGEILKKKITLIGRVQLIKEIKTYPKYIPQAGFYIGLEIGAGRDIFRFAPEVSYLNKKGWDYSYNYDLLNGVHSLGIKKRLKL